MNSNPTLDTDAAHRYFSAFCFNQAWTLIDKSDRTPAENEQMIQLAQASLWHWTQREDCTERNLSISYWQLSRIYVLVGEAENARKYAVQCRQVTPTDDLFCLGYAYEASARAELLSNDAKTAESYLNKANEIASQIDKAEDRQLLLDDLKTIKLPSPE